MESSALLRPGIALGNYPQREEPQLAGLEWQVARAVGYFRQRLGGRLVGLAALLRRMAIHEAHYADLDAAGLSQAAAELRKDLFAQGFKDELVARAFALTREVSQRTLGIRHFDSQVAGGWVMLQGKIAEMQTGEGKTLAATLPACTAALSGIPVHVVTVNDYLVTRDAEWMRPVYETLGLTVGTITEEMDADARRVAYGCDITYCTNKQLVFDYLKDRLVVGRGAGRLRLELQGLHQTSEGKGGRLLLRGLCFAIVDEADSVLVDEARTPLIISQSREAAGESRRYRQALQLANTLGTGVDYTVDLQRRDIEFTSRGKGRLWELVQPMGGIWQGERQRESLVLQALHARHMFERDKHYLVRDGKVQIIDEYTGRVMPDRSWEQGLHQLIEVKEGCEITSPPDTLARISYQRFFRRYLRLAGMTGTAREISGELWSVYRLGVVTIPTHRPPQRRRLPTRVYGNGAAKWRAVVERIRALHTDGRPVLVGTRSVAASEHLSALLEDAGLPHRVLNARQDQAEAEIVADAGQPGRITVATNMAGRGTDIHLGPGVAELGGLHVIATERHEARRIDRQLFGRCARQGDPGSFESLLAIDDELVSTYYRGFFTKLLGRAGTRGCLVPGAGAVVVARAQRAAERRHARMRRALLKMDEYLGNVLAFSGRPE